MSVIKSFCSTDHAQTDGHESSNAKSKFLQVSLRMRQKPLMQLLHKPLSLWRSSSQKEANWNRQSLQRFLTFVFTAFIRNERRNLSRKETDVSTHLLAIYYLSKKESDLIPADNPFCTVFHQEPAASTCPTWSLLQQKQVTHPPTKNMTPWHFVL